MKSNKQTGKSRKSGGMSVKSTLSDGPSYQGQAKVRLSMQGVPYLKSTTVTTGVIASNIGVDVANIVGFSSRFGSTFDEYRILGVDVKVTPVSASQGVTKFWFDEKNQSAPTLNEAEERYCIPLPNTNASPKAARVFRWRARDLLDLEYTAIGTSFSPVCFKLYTDSTSFGAPVVVTPLWLIEIMHHIEFRGLKST